MTTLLIDSPFANLANIERALRTAGGDVVVSKDPDQISEASSIVLPGVGSFAASAQWLARTSIADAIRAAVAGGAWLLGVCVGHQLLFDGSDEMEETAGLGLIEGRVTKFSTSLPIPQIGWNSVSVMPAGLFQGLPSSVPFYFVNSYRATGVATELETGTAVYGGPFNAAVRLDRIAGVQFHPEKSSVAGLRVLQNFVEMSS